MKSGKYLLPVIGAGLMMLTVGCGIDTGSVDQQLSGEDNLDAAADAAAAEDTTDVPAEETATEEAPAEEAPAEEAPAEEPVAEEPVTEEPVAEEPVAEGSEGSEGSEGVIVCYDDEAEAPYPDGTLFADMEAFGGSNNWVIIEDNDPQGGAVGPEDRQWVAQDGRVYAGTDVTGDTTGAPDNELGVPVGEDLGTIEDFLASIGGCS